MVDPFSVAPAQIPLNKPAAVLTADNQNPRAAFAANNEATS
jgi:hypothetical protein